MVMCFVPDCNHYSEKQICSWFRFPKDPTLKQKWINNIRRKDRDPSNYSLICSCHFINGDKKNLPTIFDYNKDRKLAFGTPEKNNKRMRKEHSKDDAVNINVSFNDSVSSLKSVEDSESLPGTSRASGRSISSSSTSLVQEKLGELSLGTSSSAQQEAEMYFLRKDNEMLQNKLDNLNVSFSFDQIENNDKLINIYTGIPNKYLFDTLFSLFENKTMSYYLGWNVGNISKKNQFLITLMKLRLNLLYSDLACRFNCSPTTISNIVYTWIYALHEVLVSQFMKDIPSRQKNKSCLPSCFCTFTNCRIVLDCTEVKCVKPLSMDKQRLTYSSYKHTNTLKALIGVAPNGVVTYVSDLYPGSTSDKKIVENCGILEKMEIGDLILADKGFLIKDLLPQGVSLNIPAFLTTAQFTPQQAIQTRTIARARIHVERAIRRIKCYSILDSIPHSLFPQSSMIMRVCGALTNMQFPLITEVEDLYE